MLGVSTHTKICVSQFSQEMALCSCKTNVQTKSTILRTILKMFIVCSGTFAV